MSGMSIAETRQTVVDTINGEVNLIRPNTAVYGETVPQNVESGILVTVDDLTITDVIEGIPNITSCLARAVCFSFNSRYECDQIADATIKSITGKPGDFFNAITLKGFENVDYDETFGVFVDVLTFNFPIKHNAI